MISIPPILTDEDKKHLAHLSVATMFSVHALSTLCKIMSTLAPDDAAKRAMRELEAVCLEQTARVWCALEHFDMGPEELRMEVAANLDTQVHDLPPDVRKKFLGDEEGADDE